MNIKILGTGCPTCQKLEDMAKQAVRELNISATFEKVKDIDKILDYNVIRTPGLVIDEELKSSGKLTTLENIKKWILESETK